MHVGDRGLGGHHLAHVAHRPELEHAIARAVVGEHLGLVVGGGIAERDADHEAVELGLGKRVGAFVVERVLGGDDEERAGELVGVHVDGHLALLHALEQARLGLRRRAVYLVDQHDVGEHRAGAKLKPRLALVEDARAHDV